MQIQNSNDLLAYLLLQMNSGQKDWFGYPQQKIAGMFVAYNMAVTHGDKMTPEEIVDYVVKLNNCIFTKMIVGR